MDVCEHVVVYEGLCASCGAEIKNEVEYDDKGNIANETRSSAGFASRNLGIAVSTDFVEKAEGEKFQKLLKNRKAVLVADLDHTLIHATTIVQAHEYLNPTLSGGVWGSGAACVEQKIRENPDERVELPYLGEFKTRCYMHLYKGDRAVTEDNVKRRKVNDKDHEDLEDILLSKPMNIDPLICGTVGRKSRYPHYVIGENESDNIEIEAKLSAWEMNTHLVIHDDPLSLSHSVAVDKDSTYRAYIKLRPGVLRFLRDIAPLFELYVYTAGTTNHSTGCLALLDPLNLYFGSNIFTRDHMPNDAKSLRHIFPTLHPMVCVIDDSDVGVWDVSQTGLIKVWAYNYWPSDNNPMALATKLGASSRIMSRCRATQAALLNSIKTDQAMTTDALYDPFDDANDRSDSSEALYDDDFQIAVVARILKEVHTNYYEQISQLYMLLDIETITVSDLPSLRQILCDSIYSPLSKNTFIAPLYTEQTVGNQEIVRAVCYDYWILFSQYYEGGLLYRILGLAVCKEDQGYRWIGEITNKYLCPWFMIPPEPKQSTDLPELDKFDEWQGYASVGIDPDTNKLQRFPVPVIKDKVYVAVAMTKAEADAKLTRTGYEYLDGCVGIGLNWLEGRLYGLVPVGLSIFNGPERRHFWTHFFNIPGRYDD